MNYFKQPEIDFWKRWNPNRLAMLCKRANILQNEATAKKKETKSLSEFMMGAL